MILTFFKNFFEKCHGNFDRGQIESIHGFEWYGNFNNINSSDPYTWNIFLLICVFNFFHQCPILNCQGILRGLDLFVVFIDVFTRYLLLKFIPKRST